MEQIPNENLNQDSEQSKMRDILLIQKELIEESGINPEKWINTYSESFRKITEEEPDIINDKEEIKRRLKKETIH
ncbi:MAG: hypothetical protein GF387_00610 [Candidatus Portnoybacteria bacterium]|nr:hypothetical protein [Candidatus Portnoybacteria bacterium]